MNTFYNYLIICILLLRYFICNTIVNTIAGYFTSRPALKLYARKMNSLLQVCKQVEMIGEVSKSQRLTAASSRHLRKLKVISSILNLFYIALSLSFPIYPPPHTHTHISLSLDLSLLIHLCITEEALAVNQHHDAIS